MKRLVLTLTFAFLATPVLAQEVDLGLGGDASSLLNIPAPRGNTPPPRGGAPVGRGASPGRGAAPNAPPVDRLVRLRELLTTANAPLTKEQELALSGVLNAEIPAMRRTLQTRIAELQKTNGAAAPAPGAPPALPSMEELTPEIIRLNDQLLGKMAAAPGLSPQQQAFMKKLYKDQVKSRGGFDAIKLTMEDAGTPFSPEQLAQIQPLFDAQNKARLQLVKESQGQPPDKAKLDQLQRETLAKVVKLLTAPQRTALLAK